MARPKEVRTGEGTVAVQAEIPGTEQKKIASIERAADKYDEKRRMWQGLGDEMKTLKAKVVEEMHANADKLEKDTDETLYYVRGDYRVIVGAKETVKVKIAGEPEPVE